MVGSGIVVKLYDAEEGYNVDIVHDRDVRDVVNGLCCRSSRGIRWRAGWFPILPLGVGR